MGEIVSYPRNDESSEGYLALPTSGTGPAVIVLQERWGVVPQIAEVANRFAAAGFVAFVPDLHDELLPADPDGDGKLIDGRAMDVAAEAVAQAAAYLSGRDDVEAGIAAVGFGAGASLALWSGTRSDEITTVVGFYPSIPWEGMSQQWPNYAGKAVLIHCDGDCEPAASPGVQIAKHAMEQAGGEVKLHEYAGTHHAFFNDDRPEAYDRSAAASAWARTLELLRARLG
jgi:carboxymethylenebutenolidase